MIRRKALFALGLISVAACSNGQSSASITTPGTDVSTTTVATTSTTTSTVGSEGIQATTTEVVKTSSVPSSSAVAPPSGPNSVVPRLPSSSSAPVITDPGPRTYTFTIPMGTAARIQDGENVDDVLPSSLGLRVGDRLVVINQDEAFHIYGPLGARSGETIQYEFLEPGNFQGICTTSSDRTVTINVT